MILFEKKGFVRILLLLLNNQNSIDSKYKLKKSLELSNNSLNECLEILKNFKLIDVIKDIGPRNRTEIKLTERGIKIAQSLEKSLSLLKSTKTDRLN
jgi:DNA-binding HxlR family transcriptional regulator